MAAKVVVLGAVWVSGAALAIGVGVAAVHQVARSVGDGGTEALSVDDVRSALAAVPSRTPGAAPTILSPSPSTGPSQQGASPVGAPRTVSTAGGRVVAQCRAGGLTVVYATPSSGFRTVRSQKGERTLVTFVGARREVRVELRCKGLIVDADVKDETSSESPRPSAEPSRTPSASPTPDDDDGPTLEPSESSGGHDSRHGSSPDE